MAFSIDKYHFNSESIIENLPDAELRLLKGAMKEIEAKKNKILFREGTFPKGVYILKKGKVKIYKTNKEGKQAVIYIFRKGEIFGYRPLLCNEAHPASGAALEDCRISFIDKKNFSLLLDQCPVLVRKLLVNLSHEFSVLVNQVMIFSQQPVRERVALTLRILNEKFRGDSKIIFPVTVNLSREDIAHYAGTSVETLVRVLRQFKDDEIIRTQGRKIIILKPKALEKIAEFY
ncbi:MAG TPA: Crp/Fnr family transcriptional regulator [Bacteroidia bacterium]|jgi:CRP-like cAMP-binding protein|nr:Crp/Fnr family transcriptional regulator [Bacteroidia bacterium]